MYVMLCGLRNVCFLWPLFLFLPRARPFGCFLPHALFFLAVSLFGVCCCFSPILSHPWLVLCVCLTGCMRGLATIAVCLSLFVPTHITLLSVVSLSVCFFFFFFFLFSCLRSLSWSALATSCFCSSLSACCGVCLCCGGGGFLRGGYVVLALSMSALSA